MILHVDEVSALAAEDTDFQSDSSIVTSHGKKRLSRFHHGFLLVVLNWEEPLKATVLPAAA